MNNKEEQKRGIAEHHKRRKRQLKFEQNGKKGNRVN
jgi:hypothetical protein